MSSEKALPDRRAISFSAGEPGTERGGIDEVNWINRTLKKTVSYGNKVIPFSILFLLFILSETARS